MLGLSIRFHVERSFRKSHEGSKHQENGLPSLCESGSDDFFQELQASG